MDIAIQFNEIEKGIFRCILAFITEELWEKGALNWCEYIVSIYSAVTVVAAEFIAYSLRTVS